jgi:hypothetical protein
VLEVANVKIGNIINDVFGVSGQAMVGNFSANGQRTGALDITSDGAYIIDPGCNCDQAVNTVTDMTAEMKILTSNFGAENAKGPVVIAAIGKSGGSKFHGEAYLYARDAIVDATNASNNSEGTNPLTGLKTPLGLILTFAIRALISEARSWVVS